MGRIVSGFFISLDGVVESPEQWQFPYYNDEVGAAIERSSGTAAFLMGRVLYEQWAAYWPGQARIEPGNALDDADSFASFINTVPKYVVSNTLRDPQWNSTTVIAGDVASAIRDLKHRTDGDIAMAGSATLVRWMLANGLLDELHLLIHPIVVGHGHRLFEGDGPHPLLLVRHEAFKTGVISATYAPVAVETSVSPRGMDEA